METKILNSFINTLHTQNPHYPYITPGPHHPSSLLETNTYTLISPLFQSLPTKILDKLIKEEDIKMEEEFFGGDTELIYSYLIFQLQNCKSLLFISNETGEILHQINFTPENLNKTLEELLPAALSTLPTEKFNLIMEHGNPYGGGDNDPSSPKPGEEAYGLGELENSVEISTPYETKRGQCYTIDGVRLHKPPMGSTFYTAPSNRPLLKFTDINGSVTDVFYGMLNDFNTWFLGRANSGKPFKVYLMENGKWTRVYAVRTRLNDECVTIMTDLDCTWALKENLASA